MVNRDIVARKLARARSWLADATLDHERLHEEANAGLAAMRAFLIAIADAAGL